jgi:hypothetical protein
MILCMPYTRSYNVQEDITSFKKDFKKASYILEEKVDGSLIKVYKNTTGDWTIATRGTSEANNEIWTDDLLVENEKTTYAELFLKTAKLSYDQFSGWCDQKHSMLMATDPNIIGFTFQFELCTKLNKVVIDYEEDVIYFHGISSIDLATNTIDVIKAQGLRFLFKDGNTFYKIVPLIAEIQGVNYESVEDITTRIDEILLTHGDGKLLEGCIIHKFIPRPEVDEGHVHEFRDEYFKYKTNQYVIAHKLRGQSGGLSMADAIDMYLTNEQYEFLAYYPEYTFIFDNINTIVDDMTTTLNRIFIQWEIHKDDGCIKTEKEIKKAFFTLVQYHKYFHCIMNRYAHPNHSVRDWMKKSTANSRIDFFEKMGIKNKKVENNDSEILL